MKNTKNIERVRKWQAEQKEKGLCIECSNPADGLRCSACNSRRAKLRKEKYNKWKEDGKCCQCGKDTLSGKNYCEKHYLMMTSLTNLKTQKHWADLKKLIVKQDYKCAITGDSISLDGDIQLDHIIPLYRGGKKEISNVQWVTRRANWFKRACTQEELLELCEKIVLTLKK